MPGAGCRHKQAQATEGCRSCPLPCTVRTVMGLSCLSSPTLLFFPPSTNKWEEKKIEEWDEEGKNPNRNKKKKLRDEILCFPRYG